ncbi:SMP-30/gluconolactonase/LRE family protein [bacterium]|nr:SMP-30/gluconolactonase/LRE family protein [bacterium]
MKYNGKIIAEQLDFPEGPAFDPSGHLWFVELKGGNLVRWSIDGLHRVPTQGAPNGLAFDRQGKAWFCDSEQNAIRLYDPVEDHFDTITDSLAGQPFAKPNDLSFDSLGNLVFTNPGESRTEPTGYVCCLGLDGSLKTIADQMFFPNGLAFADEGKTLIIAETYRHRLWKGKWDAENAEWIDAQPWAEVGGPIGPDGMALGRDGLLYTAVFGTGQIRVVDRSGLVSHVHDVPGQRPTNVAFDPSGNLGLVATEAENGLLLSIPVSISGVPLFQRR